MRYALISALGSAVIMLAGCDEGRIYEDFSDEHKEGRTVAVELTAYGYERWPEDYSLAIAGFRESNEYAIISKNLEFSTNGYNLSVLTGIPADVDYMEICAIDRLRRKVVSFMSVTDLSGSDTIKITGKNLDLSPGKGVQTEIFNTTCANCHGGSNFSAANLNLTAGKAFDELINVPSVKEKGILRIKPGECGESLLWMILAEGRSSDWKYDHSVEITGRNRLDLIKIWIESLDK